MGKAGKALAQVMKSHRISQNRLADAMEIDRANISRWVNEVRDPGAETLLEIRKGLRKLDPIAAEEFIQLYLEDDS